MKRASVGEGTQAERRSVSRSERGMSVRMEVVLHEVAEGAAGGGDEAVLGVAEGGHLGDVHQVGAVAVVAVEVEHASSVSPIIRYDKRCFLPCSM